MRSTCLHVTYMSMIQVRNVPKDVHRSLKARAAKAGVSLSDYLAPELCRLAHEPATQKLPMKEWLELVRSREPVGELSPSSAEIIRQARDDR